MTSPDSQVTRFGDYELNHRAGELRKNGLRIRLQEQPLQVLLALLQDPGEVVTQEELQKRIWPADTFVDFDHGLHAAVNRLRGALNDNADKPRYIETVPRRGYRFIATVEETGNNSEHAPDKKDPTEETTHRNGFNFRGKVPWNSWTGLLVGFAAALVLGAVLVVANVYGLRDWLFGPGSRRPYQYQYQSLAVLPLDNVGADPKQEYFADGMTEELITQLSKLGAPRVISHTSVMQYKGSKKSLRQIADELHVDAVVEGAVQLDGNRVRITAQLINGTTDQHIWAETYDRELGDVLLLQSDVATDIAKQIDLQLTPQQQQKLQAGAHPVNPDAYQSYLLGRYYWNKRTADGLAKSGQYFQDAIHKDPSFALAYSGLSDYYAFLTLIGGPEILPPRQAMLQSKNAAIKALQLDDSSAEAHASMGHVLHNYDWNFSKAESEFRRAIELNPNYSTAHHLYAHLLIQTGRTDEGLGEARRALELDPLSPFINNGLARQLYLARNYDAAIAQCMRAKEIDPTYLPARILLGVTYIQVGKLSDAISELTQARDMAPTLPMAHALLAYAYARDGKIPDARKEQTELTQMSHTRYVPSAYFGLVDIAFGEKDQAFSYLQQSFQDRSEQALYLKVEPLVDPLRGDPRLASLIRQVGLP
jgi:TolB-like protein/DNA-binding winged helix-turn-helix (wHTH) protein/Flp pilus assembly protein TadD